MKKRSWFGEVSRLRRLDGACAVEPEQRLRFQADACRWRACHFHSPQRSDVGAVVHLRFRLASHVTILPYTLKHRGTQSRRVLAHHTPCRRFRRRSPGKGRGQSFFPVSHRLKSRHVFYDGRQPDRRYTRQSYSHMSTAERAAARPFSTCIG